MVAQMYVPFRGWRMRIASFLYHTMLIGIQLIYLIYGRAFNDENDWKS